MTEKQWMWAGLGLGAIGLLFYILRRSQQSSGSTAPYYITGNAPNYNQNWSGTAAGLASVPAATASGCGCSSGSNGFYTSLQNMLNAFMTGASGVFQNYEQNVLSAIPDAYAQYINNPVGMQLSQAANQTLLTL